MSGDEYKELAHFIGKEFEKIHDQLEKINKRFDSTAAKEDLDNLAVELRREMGVLYEDVQHKFEIVAEGMSAINEKLDRFHDENEREHTRLEKVTLVNSADISKLDLRVNVLEKRI